MAKLSPQQVLQRSGNDLIVWFRCVDTRWYPKPAGYRPLKPRAPHPCCTWMGFNLLFVSTGLCCCCFWEIPILQHCWKQAGEICISCVTCEIEKRNEKYSYFLMMFADCCWPVFLRKMSVHCGFSEYDSRHLCAPISVSSCAAPPIVFIFILFNSKFYSISPVITWLLVLFDTASPCDAYNYCWHECVVNFPL